jgi:hypothetical protein
VLCVLCGSENRQRLLLYASLTDWFLQTWWKVFTARYGLIAYIKRAFITVLESVYSAVRTDPYIKRVMFRPLNVNNCLLYNNINSLSSSLLSRNLKINTEL